MNGTAAPFGKIGVHTIKDGAELRASDRVRRNPEDFRRLSVNRQGRVIAVDQEYRNWDTIDVTLQGHSTLLREPDLGAIRTHPMTDAAVDGLVISGALNFGATPRTY